ncbi:cell wall-binding protein [Clostridium putrefaciens]|uniref:Cell wall-binding protein n=1 Tax=Clostridium putrefaciens TaxID=99675 RepID=A0A381JBP8_9CLOT|nr:cell wall-binding protein [Clostridium putrefaciens]
MGVVKLNKGDGFLFKKKYLCIFISVSLLFTTVNVVYAAPSYVNKKENEIQENNKKIKELENRNKEIPKIQYDLKVDLNSLQNKLQEKEKQLEDIKSKISHYENEIAKIEENVSLISKDIKETEDMINKKTEEIKKREEEEKEKEEILGQRLRGMYINNPTDAILKAILDSGDFGDLISRVNNISRMIKLDKELIEEVRSMKENLESERKGLEEEKNNLDKKMILLSVNKEKVKSTQKELLTEKDNGQRIISDLNIIEENKKLTINKLEKEKSSNEQDVSKLVQFNDKARQQIDSFIKEQINSKPEEKAPLKDNNQGNSSGFIRPVGGSITNGFGERIHPITGAKGMHHGVDIAVGRGTSIKAAQSGTVITATYNNIYGNMIILSHGNGVQTVYAHAESLNVSSGQQVKQGQVIAQVGSTGISTGPHLHFEVRINGSVVNPMSYIQ